ncbi:putative phage protein [Paenibacillus larvae subsp. larvae]|nr:putative phage protein [Paenibacillus larvae subsp. larvae]ETK30277.1 putative phage protein [Paenibacillus larvae subsp. larvae DSM 25719]
MTNKKAIGLAVKKARKNKGLTQAQVATKSGLSRT